MLSTAPFEFTSWYSALPVLLAAATFTWLVSLPLRNTNLALPLWSLMLFAAGVTYALDADPRAPRLSLVLWLLAIWALRQAGYLVAHNAGNPEDTRLQALRARHQPRFALTSLYLVFWTEAALAWIVSLPLMGAFASIQPLGWLDYAGIGLWAIGFAFELFVRDPASGQRFLAPIPNYLGRSAPWWGFWLIACSAGAWWTLPGPVLVTWLLGQAQAAKASRNVPTTS